MQEALLQIIVIYIFFIGIISTLFWLIRKWFKNKIIMVLYILILVSPLFLYIPIELKTYLYGKDFKYVEIHTGFNRPVIYYRVFFINDKEAKLFYVEGENGKHELGRYYDFVKENGKWKFQRGGRTMWTNLGGSASEFTVPPCL
jgi:hypothetical protein